MSNAKLNKRQRRPTHPGELLREEILPAANITQGELAKRMGVPRVRKLWSADHRPDDLDS